MNNTSVLGFDFGVKYIGVAYGQTVTGQPKALTSLKAREGIPQWQDIEKLIEEWQPNILLVGLPLNMDDSESDMSTRARKFANRLRARFQLPVEFVDERLSSWEAKQRHQEGQWEKINAEAARIIVEQWLHSQ